MSLKTIYITIKWKPGGVFFLKNKKRMFDNNKTTMEEVAEEELNTIVNQNASLMGKTTDDLKCEMLVYIVKEKRK